MPEQLEFFKVKNAERPNQTKFEIDQAIEFHLRLDEKQSRKDKNSWPPWLLEIYKQKGGK